MVLTYLEECVNIHLYNYVHIIIFLSVCKSLTLRKKFLDLQCPPYEEGILSFREVADPIFENFLGIILGKVLQTRACPKESIKST